MSTRPSACSRASASETGKRETPSRSQMAPLSMTSPGCRSSVTMAWRSASVTKTVTLPRVGRRGRGQKMVGTCFHLHANMLVGPLELFNAPACRPARLAASDRRDAAAVDNPAQPERQSPPMSDVMSRPAARTLLLNAAGQCRGGAGQSRCRHARRRRASRPPSACPRGTSSRSRPIAAGRADREVRPDHRLRQGRRSRRATGCMSTIAASARSMARSSATMPSARASCRSTSCPRPQRATFEGFRRANGKVGTRNYIGILTSVNCSTTVAGFIAEEIERSGILDDYPNIDGIMALEQANGCVIDYRGRDLRHAQAHHLGLCHQSQHGRRAHGRARLRGVPDPAAQGGLWRHRERDLPHHDHPGDRRHAGRPSRPASRRSRRCCPIVNAARRETRAGVAN